MANTSLRSRLSRLFATNVVVRRIAKNRLKAVDTNRLQSTGNITNKAYHPNSSAAEYTNANTIRLQGSETIWWNKYIL